MSLTISYKWLDESVTISFFCLQRVTKILPWYDRFKGQGQSHKKTRKV